MKELISVIIPCFQAGKYIKRCLTSVLAQSYSNVEVIVVDDGSTDNSSSVIKEIADEDNRVRYIYQDNQGVSSARNKGLANAKGEYITFVDSDDTIKPNMYEILINLIKENDADISHCSYCRDDGKEVRNISGSGEIIIYESEEIACSLLEGKRYSPGCWNKMFKKAVVQDIYFDERYKITEDLLYTFFAFQKARKAVFCDLCLYVYHASETSSCNNTNNIKKSDDVYDVSQIIYEHSKGKEYEELARSRMENALLGKYRSYVYYGDRECKCKAKDIRRQIITNYCKNRFSGTKKIEYYLVKYVPVLFKPIYFVYNKARKPNWDL